MVTPHSIDLTTINEPCFALSKGGTYEACRILSRMDDNCCTYKCPFYKPKNCKSWVRIEDNQGINIIPMEELRIPI